ncbi:MAG: MBL fold metallo-hydrolase [Rhodocyclaceae bacterium]|nr:MBL fold metallo-hydrolase [Rhodocyclaceae bacterium]
MKPAHHREGGFCNSNGEVAIGNFSWHDMAWRTLRGDFRPQHAPQGGYKKFAIDWSTPVNHAQLAQRQIAPVVTWLGHVTILLQVAGLNILIDPTLADFAGPYGRLGAPRRVPAPLTAAQLPPIDVLLISHNHYDHLCDATIAQLMTSGQTPRIFVPLGLKAWFDTRRISNVVEMDWWDRVDLGSDLRLHFTPSQHWSRRTPFDTNASLWGGFALEWQRTRSKLWRFLFPGDTGYSNDFKTIRQRIGKIDFLALPIGAYLPRDFMKPMHVSPDDAVRLMLDLEAEQAMGVHWGTFMLTQEAFDDPPRDLLTACHQHQLAPEKIWLMKHGETRAIPLS